MIHKVLVRVPRRAKNTSSRTARHVFYLRQKIALEIAVEITVICTNQASMELSVVLQLLFYQWMSPVLFNIFLIINKPHEKPNQQ